MQRKQSAGKDLIIVLLLPIFSGGVTFVLALGYISIDLPWNMILASLVMITTTVLPGAIYIYYSKWDKLDKTVASLIYGLYSFVFIAGILWFAFVISFAVGMARTGVHP